MIKYLDGIDLDTLELDKNIESIVISKKEFIRLKRLDENRSREVENHKTSKAKSILEQPHGASEYTAFLNYIIELLESLDK